jgi:hypothetical protein
MRSICSRGGPSATIGDYRTLTDANVRRPRPSRRVVRSNDRAPKLRGGKDGRRSGPASTPNGRPSSNSPVSTPSRPRAAAVGPLPAVAVVARRLVRRIRDRDKTAVALDRGKSAVGGDQGRRAAAPDRGRPAADIVGLPLAAAIPATPPGPPKSSPDAAHRQRIVSISFEFSSG